MNALRRAAATTALVILGVLADQATKAGAMATLRTPSGSVDALHGTGRTASVLAIGAVKRVGEAGDSPFFTIELRYMQNPGIGFATFARLPQAFRAPFLLGVAGCALVLFATAMLSLPATAWLARSGLALAAAGISGNVIDRARFGFVIDMISLRWSLLGFREDLPVFNVADALIVIGLIVAFTARVLNGRARRTEGAFDPYAAPS